MGLLGSIWSDVKKGAKRLGKKVSGAVRSVGKKVSSAVSNVKRQATNTFNYLNALVQGKIKLYKKNPARLIGDISTGFVNDLYKEKGKFYIRKGKEIYKISKKIVKDLAKTKDYDDALKRGGEVANKLRKLGMMAKSELNPVGVTKNTVKQIHSNAQAAAK